METSPNTPLRRGALAAAVACLSALLLAAGADASRRVVRDAKFDVAYLTKKGRLDIIRATAQRRLTAVTHSVTMRAKVRPARDRERPTILINTRGGKRSGAEFVVYGSTVFRTPRTGPPKPVASAALTAADRTWRYRFDLDDVPGIGAGYGWAAATQKPGGRFADVAPDGGYAKSP